MFGISKRNAVAVLLLALLSSACGQGGFRSVVVARGDGLEAPGDNSSSETPGDSEVVPAPPATEPPPVEEPPISTPPSLGKMEPLSWESAKRPEAVSWSQYSFQVIDEEAFVDLDKANDATLFCPKYNSLTQTQKINFWGGLFAAMAKFESSWKPTLRYHESTMGTDPITKQPVYSEGLLQLSYQDVQWAPYCEFDWSKDKYLAPTDPKKTIFDPYKNLRCGILIMANQIRRRGAIVVSTGVYWAVLRQGGKYQKINEIAAITKQLKFCN